MKFTKEDIVSKRFKGSFKGYDKIEVEVYLEWLGDKVEELSNENSGLKKRIDEMEEDFENLAKEKKEFAEKQIKAKKQIERMKSDAAKFADQQKREAKLHSQDILKDSYIKAKDLKKDIDQLKKIKSSFIKRYQTFIRDQFETIKAFQKEKFVQDDREKN